MDDQRKTPELSWIPATDNPWQIPLLDVRAITQHMFSSSRDEQMAANAVSYGNEDGRIFTTQALPTDRTIDADLTFPIDRLLAPGVLFTPHTMEHKWAIFYHEGAILFVRSWLRQLVVRAEVTADTDVIHIRRIHGRFTDDEETAALTAAICRFLLISHALGLVFPAPVPIKLSANPQTAGMWCMNTYGNLSHFAAFEEPQNVTIQTPLRTYSMLHIAVARQDLAEIDAQLANGLPIDLLAGDGLAPLHWALQPEMIHYLLAKSSPVDVRSAAGATPLMNAVQGKNIEHVEMLLEVGADVNAADDRGFTALHRAAEMGQIELVRLLLAQGANPAVEAQGHTPLSLAKLRNEQEIVKLFEDRGNE